MEIRCPTCHYRHDWPPCQPAGPMSTSSSLYGVPPVTNEPQSWEQALDAVLAEMRSIMIERQNKYGPENIINQGLFGVIVRGAADKVARIQKALNGKIVEGRIVLDPIVDGTDLNDTFEDGLLDAANYFGPIALMVKRGWWVLPRA